MFIGPHTCLIWPAIRPDFPAPESRRWTCEFANAVRSSCPLCQTRTAPAQSWRRPLRRASAVPQSDKGLAERKNNNYNKEVKSKF